MFHPKSFKLFIILCLLQAWACTASANPVKIFAHEVKQTRFVDSLQALGTLKANEAATISASVTEVVSAVHFEDGQRVEAGDILVVLANREENALLEEAQHTLREAEQQYQRVRALVDKDIATESELDTRRLAYDGARAQLEATRSRLEDLLIIAPFDGVLGLRNISPGALVRPGDTITTLDDDTVMKLDMSVPSTYLPYLHQGMTITASAPALNGKSFEGKISSIASRVDPVTRSVQVRALVPNPDRSLRPGLLLVVELQEPPRSTIMVPEKALVRSGGETFVYVVVERDGKTLSEKRNVVPGERQSGRVEVREGLAEGEWIVTQGHLKLNDGSEIEVTAVDSGDESLEALLQQNNERKTFARDG